jgi:hypothetical protein
MMTHLVNNMSIAHIISGIVWLANGGRCLEEISSVIVIFQLTVRWNTTLNKVIDSHIAQRAISSLQVTRTHGRACFQLAGWKVSC